MNTADLKSPVTIETMCDCTDDELTQARELDPIELQWVAGGTAVVNIG